MFHAFSKKSGFLSRADQNLMCHFALYTEDALDLMARLNDGTAGENDRRQIAHDDCCTIKREKFNGMDDPPCAGEWRNGQMISKQYITYVVLVGKHFYGCANNPGADIFIFNFWPYLSKRKCK